MNHAYWSGNSQPSYAFGSWAFLRLLGLIYLAAFASLAFQIKGLAGSRGILPATEFLQSQQHWGWRRFHRWPTLCWISTADSFLSFLSWAGVALSLILICDFTPLPALVLLWVLYLSLFSVCRLFLSYQWDVLLLETGFLAMFLGPTELAPRFPPSAAPSRVTIWLFWWLLFRLMFSSGVVKLRSGDFTWRNLTALSHHYQTQPLPTPLAWFAHQLPRPFHKASVVFVLMIELVIPFLIFAPTPWRYIPAAAFIVLMLLIEATGNYCFFNLLGIALSLLLIDDRAFIWLIRWFYPTASIQIQFAPAGLALQGLSLAVAIVILTLSCELVLGLFRYELNWPGPLRIPLSWLSPFHLVSSYGLFAVMTTERSEIIVEGSADGVTWLDYEFKYKPDDPKRAPRFVAPYQPRLDWQMWFAALGYYENHPWFMQFLRRLLEGSPAVLSLLRYNPFPERPPCFIRAAVFDYRFSDLSELRKTGAWWQRARRGLYAPILELNDTLPSH